MAGSAALNDGLGTIPHNWPLRAHGASPSVRMRARVRLDTLVRLRWLAVIGQTAAVLIVHYAFDFTLPLTACLLVIGLSAALNLALRLRFRPIERLEPDRAAWLLAFDIVQLALLLYLTGGVENPFVFLFLGPVLIAATALPPRMTLMLGALAAAWATALVFFHLPLPWVSDEPLTLPPMYLLGVWFSLLVALGVIGAYAWQIAEEARLLTDALAATELVLAHEQHLSQLDGLAAAAAIEPTSPHAEDIKLLREQAQRCREILAKLTQLSASSEPFDRSKLSTLIEEVVAPHRNFGVAIDVVLPADRAAEPVGEHNPAIIYGLGNLVENAVDFARERVEIEARWSDSEVTISIADDGPGFAPVILDRIGEPYLTSRGRPAGGEGEVAGLGLGVFIAKTLLERSGAALSFANRAVPRHGATVRVHWRREDYERAGPGIAAAAP